MIYKGGLEYEIYLDKVIEMIRAESIKDRVKELINDGDSKLFAYISAYNEYLDDIKQ